MNVRVLFRSVVYANLRFFRCLLSFLCGLLNVLFFLISLLQIVSPTIRAKPGQNSNNPIHSPPACFVTAASCERASELASPTARTRARRARHRGPVTRTVRGPTGANPCHGHRLPALQEREGRDSVGGGTGRP